MRVRFAAIVVMVFFAGSVALAKGKKSVLPPYVLSAKTVAVMVDPEAGMSADDPFANQTARKDVERALLNWGRFEPMVDGQPADLIIVVRRGQKHLVSDTMSDPRQNDRAGAINPTDSGMQVGGQHGQPDTSGPVGSTPHGSTPSTQTELGPQEDVFAVYDGSLPHPLDAPPAWRYMAPDGLHSHTVPAVDQFRRVVAAAEKEAQKKQ